MQVFADEFWVCHRGFVKRAIPAEYFVTCFGLPKACVKSKLVQGCHQKFHVFSAHITSQVKLLHKVGCHLLHHSLCSTFSSRVKQFLQDRIQYRLILPWKELSAFFGKSIKLLGPAQALLSELLAYNIQLVERFQMLSR